MTIKNQGRRNYRQLIAAAIVSAAALAPSGAFAVPPIMAPCKQAMGNSLIWRDCGTAAAQNGVLFAPLNPVSCTGNPNNGTYQCVTSNPKADPSGLLAQIDQGVADYVTFVKGQAPPNAPVCEPGVDPIAGGACGDAAQVTFNVSLGGVSTTLTPAAKIAEGAYLQGVMITIVKQIASNIESELKKNRDLITMPQEVTTSATLNSSAGNVNTIGNANVLPQQANSQQIGSTPADDCQSVYNNTADTENVGSSSSDGSTAVGGSRQAAQQFCAARAAFEGQFVQAIMTLIKYRAQVLYSTTIYAQTETFENALFNLMVGDYQHPFPVAIPTGPLTAAQFATLQQNVISALPAAGQSFSSWYAANLPDEILKCYQQCLMPSASILSQINGDGTIILAQAGAPNGPSSTLFADASPGHSTPQSAFSWLSVAILPGGRGGSRRRRGRKAAARGKKPHGFYRELVSALAGAFAVAGILSLFPACNDPPAPPAPIFTSGSSGLNGINGSNGSSMSNSLGNYGNNGNSGTNNALNGGGLNSNYANGKQPEFAGGNPGAANTAAATATGPNGVSSGNGGAGGGDNSVNGNNGSQPVSLPSVASNAGLGGGGSRPPSPQANSGGGGLGSSAPTNAAISSSSDDASKAAANAAVDGGAGAGGGGGGGKGGGGGQSGNALAGLLGGLGDSPAAGAGNPMSFGAGRDLASVMGSADPADYFTRIGAKDSLFKIVARRYRLTEIGWASAMANGSDIVVPKDLKLSKEQIRQLTK